MTTAHPQPTPIPEPLRTQLHQAFESLLHIHKALLDHERTRYEHAHAPIASPGEFLQLLLHNPWFAWLRPASQLAAEIDEYLSTKQPTDPRTGAALLAQARALLTPSATGADFQRHYQHSLQESPEVALAHSAWKATLPSA